MKFSIIVPVYNAADFVSETIENLLKQNVEKEIILVNDGSTDNSLDVLRRYETEYSCIKVIDKQNGGVASARNTGILIASGDYVIFVDSDDFIEEDALKKCEFVLSNYSIDVVVFTYRICFPKRKNYKEHPELYKASGLYSLSDWIGDFWTLDNLHIMDCIGTKIYKREILCANHLLFDENTNYCEDIGFCTAYMNYVNSLYYINEPFYQYRMFNKENRISKFKPHLFLSKKYLHKQQVKMFEHIYGIEASYDRILRKIYANDIEECLNNIFGYKTVTKEDKYEELLKLSHFLALKTDLKGNTTLQKLYINILRNTSVKYQISFFQYWFSLYDIYMDYIGKYVYKVKNKFKQLL